MKKLSESQRKAFAKHCATGHVLDGEGKFELAIKAYNKAIQINPNDGYVFLLRGVSHFNQGKHEEAIKDFKNAYRINPNFPGAYFDCGAVYFERGQYELAIQEYNEAIRLYPEYADALYQRGTAYYHLGLYHFALIDFNEAIRSNPCDWRYYFNRGEIYIRQEKYDLAIHELPYIDDLRYRRDHAVKLKNALVIFDIESALKNAEIRNAIIKEDRNQFVLNDAAIKRAICGEATPRGEENSENTDQKNNSVKFRINHDAPFFKKAHKIPQIGGDQKSISDKEMASCAFGQSSNTAKKLQFK